MPIQVFFNKPARAFGTQQIINEIKAATIKVAIASAWFTDIEIAQALIDSPAKHKVAILNSVDINRDSRRAYEMLKGYFEPTGPKFGSSGPIPHGLFVLGSGDWKEGVMHHKFVLIDDHTAWTGSYNLTFQAKKNYETMVRIDDREIVNQFWFEVSSLASEISLYWGTTQFASSDTAFRCGTCEKLFPIKQMGEDHGSWLRCKQCSAE